MSESGIGQFIRKRRARLGWTQERLSEETGISRARIAQIEGGRVALPGADFRRRLADSLGVSHLDLLVAAGEITRDELGTATGVVTIDPDDPRHRLHAAIDSTPMSAIQIEGLIRMFETWTEGARRRS